MNRRSAVTLLGLLAAAPRATRAQTLAPIRAVGTVTDASGELYYALDLGLFQRHGLDVSIRTPNDNALSIPAIVSGNEDIAYTNILAIEEAFIAGMPITIIAPALVHDPGHANNFLLVPKDSPIKTALDLQGKTLGTAPPLKSLGDVATNAWVQLHGGDPATLKWVEVPYIACGDAMKAGRIDAAIVIEPYASQLRDWTRILGHPYEVIGKRFIGAAYITSRKWAAAHPDLVTSFAAAIHEAALWANANHPKSAAILAKYAKIDPQTLNQTERSVYAQGLEPADIQSTIDFAAKYKLLGASFPAGELIWKS